MAASIKQIAEKLSLSAGTVSMALNGNAAVNEATRQKVLKTAAEMGYTRHLATRALMGSIQLVIYKKHGNVVSDTPFFSELIQGIEYGARKNNCRLLISYFYADGSISQSDGSAAKHSFEPAAFNESLLATESKGTIVLATEMAESDLAFFARLNTPLVLLDSFFPGTRCDCIGIGNTHGACQAVKHLDVLGHTHIGHLASSVPIRNFYERRDGFIRGLKAAGLFSSEEAIFTIPLSPQTLPAMQDMERFLSSSPALPTAFFADNDIIAAAAVMALKKHGYRVPEDISIIGFDDVPTSAITDPPLTTMQVPKFRMGQLAVNRLFEHIRGETAETVHIELSTRLIERSSTISIE